MDEFGFAGGSAYISGATDNPLVRAILSAPTAEISISNVNEINGPKNVQNLAEQFIAGGRQ